MKRASRPRPRRTGESVVQEDRELLRPGDLEAMHGVIAGAKFLGQQGVDVRRNAGPEQGPGRLAVGFHGLGRGQGEQLALRLDDLVVDLELGVRVDHGGDDLARDSPCPRKSPASAP